MSAPAVGVASQHVVSAVIPLCLLPYTRLSHNIIYVATDEAVYKSSDTGATWTRFAGELAQDTSDQFGD